MKIHIVFEIDTLPDVGLGDVAAVVQQAAATFKSAVGPLGACSLFRITGPVQADTTEILSLSADLTAEDKSLLARWYGPLDADEKRALVLVGRLQRWLRDHTGFRGVVDGRYGADTHSSLAQCGDRVVLGPELTQIIRETQVRVWPERTRE